MAAETARAKAGTKPVPAHVQLLVDFTNSVDHELETDELTSPATLVTWLHQHGLSARSARATPAELTVALQLRDALHAAMVSHHDGGSDYAALAEVARRLPLALSGEPGGPGLRPLEDGVRGSLSLLVVAVNRSVGDGTWARLKVCSFDECAWAFFDSTKNRSRTWCEWGCGNVVKTRNYRARKRARSGS